MLNLKDTEFDDVFRRASDKYPLRTDSADWDRMAAALDKDPTPGQIDGTETDDRRRKRRVLWLLLLLPLAGAGYLALHHTGQIQSHPNASVVTAAGNRQGATSNTIQKAGRLGSGSTASAAGPAASATGGKSAAGERIPATAAMLTTAGSQSSTGISPNRSNGGISNRDISNGHISSRHISSGDISSGHNSSGDISTDPLSLRWSGDVQPVRRWSGDMQLVRIAGDYNLSVDVTAPAASINNEPRKQEPSKTKTKSSYFYAGIIGAPDISTVKMQSVKGVGSTFGLLFGYAFNSRWSIETGAYLDQKKYYSDGEYFNTEKVRLPYNYTQLLNVDGTCYMWEIPLNVRYTFNPAGKTKWFATAGLSTYLMSKENYTYAYQKWSAAGPVDTASAWNIKQPSQYPFSIVNLSAGFEQRLGRVGNLRVEPYARLPLEGIGTGKLPIMSLGINIGITRRLW